MLAYLHTCMHTYIHTNIHTYKHTYIQTYIHTYKHTYIQTYIHTYIHTHTHTHTHTLIQSHAGLHLCTLSQSCRCLNLVSTQSLTSEPSKRMNMSSWPCWRVSITFSDPTPLSRYALSLSCCGVQLCINGSYIFHKQYRAYK